METFREDLKCILSISFLSRLFDDYESAIVPEMFFLAKVVLVTRITISQT